MKESDEKNFCSVAVLREFFFCVKLISAVEMNFHTLVAKRASDFLGIV